MSWAQFRNLRNGDVYLALMFKEKDFLIEDEVVEIEEETISPEELKRREKIKKIKFLVY